MTQPCIMMEFLTTAPWPTLTPRKIMEFSTVPSMMQPSAIREFLTEELRPYLAGASSRILVKMGRSGWNHSSRTWASSRAILASKYSVRLCIW